MAGIAGSTRVVTVSAAIAAIVSCRPVRCACGVGVQHQGEQCADGQKLRDNIFHPIIHILFHIYLVHKGSIKVRIHEAKDVFYLLHTKNDRIQTFGRTL